MEKTPAIGIDLGTTYSCVAVFQYGTVEIIANDQGNRTTPSYVAFTDKGRLIGDAAKAQVAENTENTVFDVKRLIGRRFNEESVQDDIRNFPFVIDEEDDKPNIRVNYKNQPKAFSPEEISSMILMKMKETAEEYLGTKVADAVITVPAYFNNAQRQATKDAGAIAGLNVLRIINEPTAAAIAYGLDKRAQGEKNVLVFDLGGGTFDVSILTIDDGVFEVKSTSGDTHLGGEDFDTRLVTYFAQEFKKKHGLDISNDKRALRRLRTHCEQAKLTLSSSSHTTIEVPNLTNGIDFKASITRAKFEELCVDLFRSTLQPVERALADAQLDKDQIDEVILVGGSTRIPRIQRLLQEFFDGKELNKSINPDEAVAYGAAVQAAIVNGDEPGMCQDLLLLDILPLSLGIETVGGIMSTIISRNTAIPTKELHYATTNNAYQQNVFVTVYEGERSLTKDNNLLGEFELGGIRPGTDKDLPIITVTFDVDADGILSVSAVDQETGASNQITISKEARLTEEEIERKRAQAEEFRKDDEEECARIQARNYLDRYIDQVQSTISQSSFTAKATQHEQESVLQKLEQVTDWSEESGALASRQQLEAKAAELKNFCQPIIDRIYSQ